MGYKLDLRNRKLLYELDLNSRQPVSILAKKLKISKTALAYRMDKLQKDGVITQFHTVIDTGKLGYMGFRLLLKLQNATPDKKQELIDFLKSKGAVTWVVSIMGDYDLGCLILVKSVKEMNALWKEIFEKYVNYIDGRLLTVMTKVSYFSRAYLLDLNQNIYETVCISEPDEVPLDDVDLEILRLLSSDARMQIIAIAQKLKLTSKTVIARINRLEGKKIIVGYKARFDLEKLGYLYFKVNFSMHNANREKEKEFRNFVKAHPNIIYDDEVLGGDDFEIEIQVKDRDALRGILEDVQAQFAKLIKEYKIMEYYKEHKYLFFPGPALE